MSVQLLHPESLPRSEFYAQASIAQGTRTVYIAGQVARDADGTPVGAGDLAAQVEQAYRNVNAAVQAAGGTFADIAKLTVYVVDWEPSKVAQLGEGAIRAAQDLGFDFVKPLTLIGVSVLGEPDLLVEVEAIAVLP